MKIQLLSYLTLCLFATPVMAADVTKLETDKQKLSYAFGYNVGKSIKHELVDLDEAVFAQAVHDALTETASRLSNAETQAVVADFQKKRQEETQKLGEKNLQDGKNFLAANKKKKGVVTLPSGLQYKILKSAKGDKPTTTDSVVAHYRGTLINGKEFDSSLTRGEPATFPVTGVIPGWQEVLQLMPVGSKWQVFVPSELAYGARSPSGLIGPNETLIFEIELLKIAKSETPNP